jgi:hypothetical protein
MQFQFRARTSFRRSGLCQELTKGPNLLEQNSARPTAPKGSFAEMRDMGVRGLLVLPTAVTRSYCRLEPVWNWRPLLLLQRLLRPAGNQFDGTTLRQWHHQPGNCRRMNSMVELVVAVVALVSACIFLAHAIEAYRA